jgi:outer membrane protein OmpA-like peptidoglycan-associated protein
MECPIARRHGLAAMLVLGSLIAVAPLVGAEKRDPIPSFPESRVIKHTVKDLEAYWIPTGKLTGDGQAEKFQVVEGKWTHTTFANPRGSSVIEIGRMFDQKLRDAGFEIVYDCRDGDCGQGGRKTNGDWWDMTYQRRFLVAQLERPRGDLWVCVHVQAKGPNVAGTHDVDVIEAKPEPREEKVVADETDAGWLEHELSESGHVAVRGIGFDTKKLTVLGSSSPTMNAVAQLFSRDPRRKLMVVVHGDGSGDVKTDVQRCRREAAAIVQELVKKRGVAPSRVIGDGVGPLAPVASSATPEGRALNRRVELVLQNPMPDLKASRAGD